MLGRVDVWRLNFVQIKRILSATRTVRLSILREQAATGLNTRFNEPKGPRLLFIYSTLGPDCGDDYTAQNLPCLNKQQKAAKTIAKRQHALGHLLFKPEKHHDPFSTEKINRINFQHFTA
ncbi:MAG: hypothetical protein CENE_02146 [Candidatus Celerinatantimonas neptuna]|nr:MAG: hypothetical protein CENE_02146 [Candidatus Celerinatantimonas neptuna]